MPTYTTLAQAAQGGGSILSMYLMFGAVIAIWYFIVIRPQGKREENRRKSLFDSLKVGDRIVTTGGIIATVDRLGDKTFRLKIADNVRIEVLRSAVADRFEEPAESRS